MEDSEAETEVEESEVEAEDEEGLSRPELQQLVVIDEEVAKNKRTGTLHRINEGRAGCGQVLKAADAILLKKGERCEGRWRTRRGCYP